MADLSLHRQSQPAPNVHKFGGSSLKDAAHIDQVLQTIQAQVNPGDFVVVSANGQVTDWLTLLLQGHELAFNELELYLHDLLFAVLQQPDALWSQISADLQQLNTDNQHDVLALGELWSAQLLSAKLRELDVPNDWLDARDYLVVDQQQQLLAHDRTQAQLLAAHHQRLGSANQQQINIITGFIARDAQGNSTTLGRNGSDYTATLIAALLGSDVVYFWTDVDGVYSADPHVIADARPIERLCISEAQALSELGSNVLHQQTIGPILPQRTRLVINTCGQAGKGTLVDHDAATTPADQATVKTLTHKSNLVYLSVAGVSELAARQFQARLTATQINNYANHFDKTSQQLNFYIEHNDLFQTTQLLKSAGLSLHCQQTGISLISAVGQNIRQNHQLLIKLLNRSAAFAVHNIHYPANDHTWCVLLPDDQARALLQDLHDTFFALEPSIPIVVLGYGNIGRQFIRILKANQAQIEQQVNQSLSLLAVANSRCYQLDGDCLLNQGIELDQDNSKGALLQQLQAWAHQPAVIIDLTASEWVAKQYLDFARNGWHVIAANKIAAADRVWAKQVEEVLQQKRRKWLTNTTVGAALPVQDSIRKVREGGDQVKSVSGVFSGSLSWLLGHYDGERPFMDWVKQAHEQAYTEPDPREDLSGQDVYRKALILARELGFQPAQVVFEPVIPEEYLQSSVELFWQHHEHINAHMKAMWLQAETKQQQLRYLATVNAHELRVELVSVAADHPAAQLTPGDNIFIIESQWYADNPLVIQGPGAGREVTAAGVLNDLIEVLQTQSC